MGKNGTFCLGKVTDRGRSGKDNRLFLEAVLWIARTGSPWRDLPAHFGKWNTVFKRYRDWVKAGVFETIFASVNEDVDLEYAMIDGTIVKVHRHGQGAKGTFKQSIGRSRGGMTCKILALVDSLGNLIKFRLMPGQYHDLVETKPLIEDVDFQALLADKAFDADWLIQELNERKVKVVIPPKSNRKVMRAFDTIMYKWRHLIENYFCKLKEFKRIAMRSCKTDTSFEAMIQLCASLINSR